MNEKNKEFVISREFDVPRELMFKVWTDPEHMQRWWGPKDFKVIHSKMDLRPGGVYLYGIRSPDGHDMLGKFVYREIVKPERIVFVNSFSDENGGVTRHPMSPSWPLEMLSTITFTEQAGKTTVTVRWLPLNATEEERNTFKAGFDSMKMGWGGRWTNSPIIWPRSKTYTTQESHHSYSYKVIYRIKNDRIAVVFRS